MADTLQGLMDKVAKLRRKLTAEREGQCRENILRSLLEEIRQIQEQIHPLKQLAGDLLSSMPSIQMHWAPLQPIGRSAVLQWHATWAQRQHQ